MIGNRSGNAMLALECAACPAPILPGQVYYGNGSGPAIHYGCLAEGPPVNLAKLKDRSRP